MRTLKTLRVVAASIALSACADGTAIPGLRDSTSATAPPPGILTTDRTSYTAVSASVVYGYSLYAIPVVTKYTNETRDTVFLARCFPTSPSPTYDLLQIAPPDPEGSAYSPVWACVGHDQQIAVAPGAARVDMLTLRGPNVFDGITHRPFGATSGTVEVRFQPQSCRGDGACPLPDSLGTSNTFIIGLPGTN